MQERTEELTRTVEQLQYHKQPFFFNVKLVVYGIFLYLASFFHLNLTLTLIITYHIEPETGKLTSKLH